MAEKNYLIALDEGLQNISIDNYQKNNFLQSGCSSIKPDRKGVVIRDCVNSSHVNKVYEDHMV